MKRSYAVFGFVALLVGAALFLARRASAAAPAAESPVGSATGAPSDVLGGAVGDLLVGGGGGGASIGLPDPVPAAPAVPSSTWTPIAFEGGASSPSPFVPVGKSPAARPAPLPEIPAPSSSGSAPKGGVLYQEP